MSPLHAHAHAHPHAHPHAHSHAHPHPPGSSGPSLPAGGQDRAGPAPPAAERALWIALGLNAAFLGIEVAVGLFANSLALLSDAGHMLSDVAALLLAVLAQRFARSNPGGSFTFGLRRLPVLGAFGNAFSLLAIVAIIFWEAGQRLVAPAPVLGWPVLGAGVVGLLVNGVSAWLLLRSGDGSLNVRGAVLHLLADALGSLGAILSAAVLLLTGWAAIDPLISVVIGLLILFGTLPVLRDSLKVLLQAAPARLDLDRLRQLLVAEEAVLRVEDLHVWELDSGQVVLTVRLICDPARGGLAELQDAADRLRERLAQELGIGHATFEWRSSGGLPLGCGHGSG